MPRPLLVIAILFLAAGLPLPLQAQYGHRWPGSGTRTTYQMDENGNYTGQKNSEYNQDGDDNRYACLPRPEIGPIFCNPCGQCHTLAQSKDTTYRAKFDGPRHGNVHFPSLWARLRPGEKITWGKGSHLSMRGTEVVISNATTGRDQAIFPAGSTILRNKQGVAAFIVLPATGEPRVVNPVR